MVSVIVLLLTAVILFRSFERAKNAANVRVSTVVLNAATPAVDRARAKIGALLQDPSLPQGTPTEISLYTAIQRSKYTLPDETPIELAYAVNGTTETLQNSAWKFGVDTDNNGKDDTFTLYSIQFRSPPVGADGNFDQPRNPLEARTPPMISGTNSACINAAGFSTLVGSSGWYQLPSGDLAKSFFAYVVNVPITQNLYNTSKLANATSPDGKAYEVHNGNTGVIALEFQQDRTAVPLVNNAAWSEGDLESFVGGTPFYVNGRIHTNGNLLTGNTGGPVEFFQVSSDTSCFYSEQTGQITVGGSVYNGTVASQDSSNEGITTVDLYQGFGQTPIQSQSINNSNNSVSKGNGSQIGFNDAAYAARISKMLSDAMALCTGCSSATTGAEYVTVFENTAKNITNYPPDIISAVTANASVLNTETASEVASFVSTQIQLYLQNRTRQVPYAEVPDPTGVGATSGYTGIGTDSTIADALAPQKNWREPLDSSNNFVNTNGAVSLNTAQLQATYPITQEAEGTQNYLGDRIFVGNNLPAYWVQYDSNGNGKYVSSNANQLITDNSGNPVDWYAPANNGRQQWRNTQIQAATNIGVSSRNGFWEEAAATIPASASDSVGGLRIVTGAGIYVDDGYYLNNTNGVGGKYTIPPSPQLSRCNGSPILVSSNPAITGYTNCPYATSASSNTLYSFLPTPPPPIPAPQDNKSNYLPYISVWPDTMPMTDIGKTANLSNTSSFYSPPTGVTPTFTLNDALRGDLLMRASVVYHYASNTGTPTQTNSNLNNDPLAVNLTPVACISSYYDPTTNPNDPNVASSLNRNSVGNSKVPLPWNAAPTGNANNPGKIGRSNNGIVYPFPGRSTYATYQAILQRQALLIFPNGRWANQALQNALSTVGNATDLSSVSGLQQSDYSAIDAALCAISILNAEDSFIATPTNLPPHGAIKEATILDGREEKQNGSLATSYAAFNSCNNTPCGTSPSSATTQAFTSQPYIYAAQPNNYQAVSNPISITVNPPSDGNGQATLLQTQFLTNYDLDLELRQPMEVRLTDIDLGLLAQTQTAYTVSSGCDSTGTKEYFLPCSGIIYATRDDALPDANGLPGFYLASGSTDLTSPTDFQLDPTRRPNGIRLIDGESVARDPSNNKNAYNARENGLILATNLPAYIKATGYDFTNTQVFSTNAGRQGNLFNVHETSIGSTTQIQEFTQKISGTNYSNFYSRNTPDTNFACRVGRTGCSATTTGDYWRPVSIIADAMTLLSGTYVDGYRSDTDYDLNNNTGRVVEANFNPTTIGTVVSPNTTSVYSNLDTKRQDRLQNGFWENYYADNAAWYSTSSTDPSGYPIYLLPKIAAATTIGSYALNGVTPIQRRWDNYPTYVMEICRKMLVSECTQPNDWVIGFDIDGDGTLTGTELGITSATLGQAIVASYGSNPAGGNNPLTNSPTIYLDWDAPFPGNTPSIRKRLGAGDTAGPPLQTSDQYYPRRVAFARNYSVPNTRPYLVATNAVNTYQPLVDNPPPALYQPLGINCPLDVTGSNYSANGCTYSSNPVLYANYGKLEKSTLWFTATNSATNPGDLTQSNTTGNNANNAPLFYYPTVTYASAAAASQNSQDYGQPLLSPVLNHYAYSVGGDQTLNSNNSNPSGGENYWRNNWIQQASQTNTTINAAFVVGNSPSRPNESSAGIQNFVRFLENWEYTGTTSTIPLSISGSFIQQNRSSFATGPQPAILYKYILGTSPGPSTTNNFSLYDNPFFAYPTQNNNGQLPHYSAPGRAWGFDVAILAQQPDLFAERFTVPSSSNPNEFFREVDRTDPWVSTLLCATNNNVSTIQGSEYLPSNCQQPN
jgi:hypothetical protein